jgi:hypothetical protein
MKAANRLFWAANPFAHRHNGRTRSMASPTPHSDDPRHQVIDFGEAARHRQDGNRQDERKQGDAKSPVNDLRRYEQAGEADDYRQRMTTNLIAAAALILLIVAGIWIADTMATMRKNQDCVLSGRRGCTPVEAPAPQRW